MTDDALAAARKMLAVGLIAMGDELWPFLSNLTVRKRYVCVAALAAELDGVSTQVLRCLLLDPMAMNDLLNQDPFIHEMWMRIASEAEGLVSEADIRAAADRLMEATRSTRTQEPTGPAMIVSVPDGTAEKRESLRRSLAKQFGIDPGQVEVI